MRIGILTLTQTDTDRPYVWTSVTKARAHVAAGTHKQVGNGKLRVIKELYAVPQRGLIRAISLVERQYAEPALTDRIYPDNPARPSLCSPNQNLDLSYPEPMRVTVGSVHPGLSKDNQ